MVGYVMIICTKFYAAFSGERILKIDQFLGVLFFFDSQCISQLRGSSTVIFDVTN